MSTLLLAGVLATPVDVGALAEVAVADRRGAGLRAIRALGQRDDAAGAAALRGVCARPDRCGAAIEALAAMPSRWALVALDSLSDDPSLTGDHRTMAAAAARSGAWPAFGASAWPVMLDLVAASDALAAGVDRALRGSPGAAALAPMPVYAAAGGPSLDDDVARLRDELERVPGERAYVWTVALVGLRGGEVVAGLQVAFVPQAGGAASVVPGVPPAVAAGLVPGLPDRMPDGVDALLTLGPAGLDALRSGSCGALPTADVDALAGVLGETGSVAMLRRAEVEGRRLRCGDGATIDEVRVVPTALHVLFERAPGRPGSVLLGLTSPGGVLGVQRVSSL